MSRRCQIYGKRHILKRDGKRRGYRIRENDSIFNEHLIFYRYFLKPNVTVQHPNKPEKQMKDIRKIAQSLYKERLPDNPQTFTEKLRWKMKCDRRPILTTTADKYEVIRYLEEKGFGHLLKKLYFVTDKPDEIPFDELPDRYVIKSNHRSGDVIIIDNRFDIASRATVSREEIISRCHYFLRSRHCNELNEWAYQNIKPMILVEEFLSDENGLPHVDYKFLCFGGKAKIVEVIEDRFGDFSDSFFDMSWKPLDFTWSDWPGEKGAPPRGNVPKPPNFEEMKKIAEALGKPFDFVRVDLYNVSGKIYFGEFTHYPSAGIGEIEPKSFDAYVGKMWTLPEIDKIRDNSLIGRLKEKFIFLWKYRTYAMPWVIM